MKKISLKKSFKNTTLLILLLLVLFLTAINLFGGTMDGGGTKHADKAMAKNIEMALQLSIVETGVSDITQYRDSSGKNLLPTCPTFEDIIKMLKSTIVMNNKAYGPYLRPDGTYIIQWNEEFGGKHLGYYIRVLKDTKKAFVRVISVENPYLANRVDIIDSNHLFAKTSIPTLSYEKE